jgi:hypothetical protein
MHPHLYAEEEPDKNEDGEPTEQQPQAEFTQSEFELSQIFRRHSLPNLR